MSVSVSNGRALMHWALVGASLGASCPTYSIQDPHSYLARKDLSLCCGVEVGTQVKSCPRLQDQEDNESFPFPVSLLPLA